MNYVCDSHLRTLSIKGKLPNISPKTAQIGFNNATKELNSEQFYTFKHKIENITFVL